MANPYIDNFYNLSWGQRQNQIRSLSGYNLTPNVFGEILAREKIYHPKDLDNRVGFLDWLIQNGSYLFYYTNPDEINSRVKAAAESKTYLDAMKAWELRKAEPGRYAAFGLEGLGNLDILSEIQGRLQRRNVLGRRRVEEPALAPQGDL